MLTDKHAIELKKYFGLAVSQEVPALGSEAYLELHKVCESFAEGLNEQISENPWGLNQWERDYQEILDPQLCGRISGDDVIELIAKAGTIAKGKTFSTIAKIAAKKEFDAMECETPDDWKKSVEKIAYEAESVEAVAKKLSCLQKIELKIVGSWLWISGDTYEKREQLKKLGCKWSRKKSMWYYTASKTPFFKRNKELEYVEIVAKYGEVIL
jgi:hypothetical protein